MTHSEPPKQETHSSEQNVFIEEIEGHTTEKKTTMSGLDENIAGLLSYIVVVGIAFIFIEKENMFVRFHAFQSTFTFIAIFSTFIILSLIPIIGWIIAALLSPLTFLLALFLMYQAYNGKKYKLPFVGNLAEKYATGT